jgi:ribonucleoside-triphosphate reductase
MEAKSKPKRQECEVYSRVVGYLRPVNQWNDAKRAEFRDRKVFKVKDYGDKVSAGSAHGQP